MTDANAGMRRLDAYLGELRGRLRRLPDAEVAEIVDELRSHVRDSDGVGVALTEEAVAAALERLGPPEELAALYVTDSLLVRAERSWSPWLIFTSIFRWATVSVAGFFAFLGVLVGFVLSASFFIAALAKPFFPDRTGLWRVAADSVSLHLGLASGPPPAGQELLGWWIVPSGLLVGVGGVWLTTRFGRWCIRRFRRTRRQIAAG
jgi:hypothetical protein